MRLPLVLLLTGLAACRPFDASADAAGAPRPSDGGASGAADAAGGACDAAFCETFDDDALEGRGWTRVGSARVEVGEAVSKPGALFVERPDGSQTLALVGRRSRGRRRSAAS